MVARQRRADRRRPLRRRGPRHRHRGQPRRAAQGLPHRLRGGARPPPRRADRGGRGRRARRPARARRARRDPRAQRPARRRRRGRDRHHRPRARRGRRPVVGLARERGWHEAWRLHEMCEGAGGRDEPPAHRRRRRLPQRRQEHPGQPAGRRPRGGHRRRARRHPRPQAPPTASGTASPSSCSTPAGSTSPTRASWPRDVQRQARLGIAEADVVLLVVDARAGAARRRRRAGEDAARRRGRRSSSSSTKSTAPATSTSAAEFHKLGLGEPIAVSATHGLGSRRPARPRRRAAGRAAEPPRGRRGAVRVAVIGRPNVGKSSLVNAFLGAERVIVSERAGTTRDAIDTELEVDGRRVVLVDTAGLRRRSKVAGTGRLLRPAALRARGRARRRRARRLRRRRGRHLRGPARRRAGDARRLRDPAGAQQVGRDRAPTSTTPAPGSSASLRLRPERRHLLGDARPQRRRAAAARRWSWPTAPPSGSRPRS